MRVDLSMMNSMDRGRSKTWKPQQSMKDNLNRARSMALESCLMQMGIWFTKATFNKTKNMVTEFYTIRRKSTKENLSMASFRAKEHCIMAMEMPTREVLRTTKSMEKASYYSQTMSFKATREISLTISFRVKDRLDIQMAMSTKVIFMEIRSTVRAGMRWLKAI